MHNENRPKTPPPRSTGHRAPLANVTNTPFPTPRRRKTPNSQKTPLPPTQARKAAECAWPRYNRQVPIEDIISAAEKIFAYKPKPWQLEVFQKIAQGHDTFAIAGTGMGKSLPFALLAIAAELSQTPGTVIVVCPLKSLEMDQMARFNLHEIEHRDGTKVKVTAVAINEDNKDDALFTKLRDGAYRICYASPECLLRNHSFKKLFRREQFRKRIISLAVDEAHVIQDWKDNFRKDYNELSTLKVIAGSEIPWAALTATCSTSTFQTIFDTLGMGRSRSFWGIDMGADRPNLAQWVRRMEYSKSSMADLFAFVPPTQQLQSSSDLVKTVFYFKTRALARRAMRRCRRLLPSHLREFVTVYTATNSEPHKQHVIASFKANTVRWVFTTLALGMGLDVPDIERVVVYGVCVLSEMYQKGGRAGRDPNMKAVMIWIVESWAFNRLAIEDGTSDQADQMSKREEEDKQKRTKMDPASRGYINCSTQNLCHREFICNHFRPSPMVPNLQIIVVDNELVPIPEEQPVVDNDMVVGTNLEVTDTWDLEMGSDDEGDSLFGSEHCLKLDLKWLVRQQELAKGVDCGCSSRRCTEANQRVGQLSDPDKLLIDMHIASLTAIAGTNTMSSALNGTTKHLSVSKAERVSLRETLQSWRDDQWAEIRPKYLQLSRDWVLSDADLTRIVAQAHCILNAPQVDSDVLCSISEWISSSLCLDKLVNILQEFREQRLQREQDEVRQRPPKRSYVKKIQYSNNPCNGGTFCPVPNTPAFKVTASPANSASPAVTFMWSV